MTYQHDFTLSEDLLEQLAVEGLEGLPEMIRVRRFAALEMFGE